MHTLQDTNLTDSLGYEIPIQGRPSSHLQPQRQQHNDLPELPIERKLFCWLL